MTGEAAGESRIGRVLEAGSTALALAGGLVALEVAANYPQIVTDELYVDTAAYWMVKDPTRFDVILTPNLYGDILSDMAAAWGGRNGFCAMKALAGPVPRANWPCRRVSRATVNRSRGPAPGGAARALPDCRYSSGRSAPSPRRGGRRVLRSKGWRVSPG